MAEIQAVSVPKNVPKVRKIGVYSRPAALARLDGRTREGRMIRDMRAELVGHLGGSPSATQRCIIDRAAMLGMQIAQLDAKAGAAGMTAHDQRTYLAWVASYTRLLRQLGLKGADQQAPSLREHLARQGAA